MLKGFFHDKGWSGVSQKVILHDEGGGGVQTPLKKYDIIYEQLISDIVIMHLYKVRMAPFKLLLRDR